MNAPLIAIKLQCMSTVSKRMFLDYYHYIHNYRPTKNHIFLIFQERDFSVIQADELVVAKHRNGR